MTAHDTAAIRAHYAPLADLITAQAEESRRLRETLEEAIHDADQTLIP